MGPCTGLHKAMPPILGKAGMQLGAKRPHPGHLAMLSSKPPAVGSHPEPRGTGIIPSPMGTWGDTQSTQQDPRA